MRRSSYNSYNESEQALIRVNEDNGGEYNTLTPSKFTPSSRGRDLSAEYQPPLKQTVDNTPIN